MYQIFFPGESICCQSLEEDHHRFQLDQPGQVAAVLAAGRHRALRHVRMLLAETDSILLGKTKKENNGRTLLYMVLDFSFFKAHIFPETNLRMGNYLVSTSSIL